jgi:phosphoribosylformimino-5-aminoimidazole carboxamide ribotide isomerase
MIIYPAIDLRGGKVVRLKEGDPTQQTIFSDDPVETARNWQAQGATWIHMVNLDGAFAEANDNGAILKQAAALGVKIQFGGGLRSLEDIGKALEQGASRVVLGTVAIQQPEIIEQAIAQWGAEAICIALDARDGQITTHGWQSASEWTPVSFGQHIAAMGARHALYTDVRRDGLLTGADVSGTIALGQETGLQVIASGGVQGLAEIRELAQSGAVAGAIIGMALYTGQITLPDALQAATGA